jgi:bHLH factor
MSVEMADQTEFDHSGLQEIANAMRETTAAAELLGQSNQKRKRESDHDGSADATGRAGPKRVSSEEHKSMNEDNVAANAFMDSQHDQNAVDSLQEYSNAHDQSLGQNGADEHANASSTAAAALGMYPAMNMPPPGGVQFQTQGTEQDNNDTSFMDQSQDQSYLDNSHQQHQIQPSPPQQSTPSGRGANKPAVGSEEWHKVRKDNHKEG